MLPRKNPSAWRNTITGQSITDHDKEQRTMRTSNFNKVIGLAVALFALATAGCKTNHQAAANPSRIETQEVAFPKELDYAREMKVTNPNDPEQSVTFALSLSQRGRHMQAAEFLQNAADRFVSRDNEFGVSCRAAAANEFLQANDVNSFRETVAKLRKEMNRFQLAGADESISIVLALGDLAAGAEKPSSLTPKPLRELYPSVPGQKTSAKETSTNED